MLIRGCLFFNFSRDENVRHLQLQLSYVYNQIISVLTLTSLNKIFKQRVNYDLRRMLGGTEKFIDNILKVMDNDTSYLLGSVRCLPLNPSVRDTITQTLLQCCKVKVSITIWAYLPLATLDMYNILLIYHLTIIQLKHVYGIYMWIYIYIYMIYEFTKPI